MRSMLSQGSMKTVSPRFNPISLKCQRWIEKSVYLFSRGCCFSHQLRISQPRTSTASEVFLGSGWIKSAKGTLHSTDCVSLAICSHCQTMPESHLLHTTWKLFLTTQLLLGNYELFAEKGTSVLIFAWALFFFHPLSTTTEKNFRKEMNGEEKLVYWENMRREKKIYVLEREQSGE